MGNEGGHSVAVTIEGKGNSVVASGDGRVNISRGTGLVNVTIDGALSSTVPKADNNLVSVELPRDISENNVVLRGSGILEPGHTDVAKKSAIEGIRSGEWKYTPTETESISVEKEAILRDASLEDEEIDPDIRESEERVRKYMVQVAEEEGIKLGKGRDTLTFHYVPRDKYNEIHSKDNSGGFASQLSRHIYVSYPPNFVQQSKVDMAISQMHEARHIVTEPSYTFSVVPDGDDVSLLWSKPRFGLLERMTANGREGGIFLEELYTVAWTDGNIENVLDEEMLTYFKLRDNSRKMRTTSNYVESSRSMEESSYAVLGEVFQLMESKIPDLLNILGHVARGTRGYRNLLARSISDNFGHDGLVAFTNTEMATALNLRDIVRAKILGQNYDYRKFPYMPEESSLDDTVKFNLEQLLYYKENGKFSDPT